MIFQMKLNYLSTYANKTALYTLHPHHNKPRKLRVIFCGTTTHRHAARVSKGARRACLSNPFCVRTRRRLVGSLRAPRHPSPTPCIKLKEAEALDTTTVAARMLGCVYVSAVNKLFWSRHKREARRKG